MRLRDFVPPIVAQARRRCHVYGSWQDAEAACGRDAYQGADLVDVVFAKTRVLRDALSRGDALESDGAHWQTPLAVALAAHEGTASVIDLGGACGAEYFMLRRLFDGRLRLRWAVVETPAMVSKGQAFADADLRFFDDVSAAVRDLGTPDLAYSSGTLQYCSNAYDLLGRMLDTGATDLFLTRLLLTERPADLVGVQESSLAANGPGPLPDGVVDRPVKYPVCALSRKAVEDAIASRYVVKARFREVRDAFRFGADWASTHGFLCERLPRRDS